MLDNSEGRHWQSTLELDTHTGDGVIPMTVILGDLSEIVKTSLVCGGHRGATTTWSRFQIEIPARIQVSFSSLPPESVRTCT
jgi:hypothetical protein